MVQGVADLDDSNDSNDSDDLGRHLTCPMLCNVFALEKYFSRKVPRRGRVARAGHGPVEGGPRSDRPQVRGDTGAASG